MERVQLSKRAKAVLKSLRGGASSCSGDIPQNDFNMGAIELQIYGFAKCFREEGGNVEVARLTDKGKLYIMQNPRLRNPINWTRVAAIAACIAALAAVAALFVSCAIYIALLCVIVTQIAVIGANLR